MTLTAALDASVLYPLPLRDTLLRVAQVGVYDPCWSERILDEVARNLIANRVATAPKAAAMLDAMRDAFDAAIVVAEEIARLEPTMTNDSKDRHVLAAAAAGQAEMLVTLNLRDFPSAACEPLSIEAIHPDRFLLDLYQLDPDAIHAALALQATALANPPMSVADILDRLMLTVPGFAETLRNRSSAEVGHTDAPECGSEQGFWAWSAVDRVCLRCVGRRVRGRGEVYSGGSAVGVKS